MAELIEQAFAGGYVEESITGSWDDIQVELGLKTRAEVPRRSIFSSLLESEKTSLSSSRSDDFLGTPSGHSKTKRKAKNKQQAAARRKNRKKKK